MTLRHVRILLVTGLPGTGKTTLARATASRYRVPLICKDRVKEPLLDVLGAPDAVTSRQLSTASFAVLFSITQELLSAGISLVLEGNFRPGEHEEPLHALLHQRGAGSSCYLAQVLCRVDESERMRRLHARAADPSRHQGHRIGELAAASALIGDSFLDVPGDRFLYEGDSIVETLDRWWTAH